MALTESVVCQHSTFRNEDWSVATDQPAHPYSRLIVRVAGSMGKYASVEAPDLFFAPVVRSWSRFGGRGQAKRDAHWYDAHWRADPIVAPLKACYVSFRHIESSDATINEVQPTKTEPVGALPAVEQLKAAELFFKAKIEKYSSKKHLEKLKKERISVQSLGDLYLAAKAKEREDGIEG